MQNLTHATVSGTRKTAAHARVISALLSLLLGAPRPDSPRSDVTRPDTPRPDTSQLTPQQRDIYDKLSSGRSYKEIAHALGISHNTLLVQLTLMRKRLGDEIIPRLRRRQAAQDHRNTLNSLKNKAFRF